MLRLATRRSALAKWQAEEVARLLREAHPDLDIQMVFVDTIGDRRQDRQVWELGGQGIFVKEVQAAVLSGEADVAVHSAKDLPSTTAPGLLLAAFPQRADPRDALVGAPLAELELGATVATGSVRRRVQLAWLRPDLNFVGLRGNIATRLERIPVGGAVVVARAALDRLGISALAVETLEPAVMLPQVGQGAIGIECRLDDAETAAWLAGIDHPLTAVAVRAERAFLARLGSGCDLPVGAYATLRAADAELGVIEIEGMVASLDGRMVLRERCRGESEEGERLGAELAESLLRRAESAGPVGPGKGVAG